MESNYKPELKSYTSTLSQMAQLTELTFQTGSSSSLKEVSNIFRQIVDLDGTKQKLKSLTLQEFPGASEWDNPWGAARDSSRVFQATRRPDLRNQQGPRRSNHRSKKPALEIQARQTHGPPPERTTRKPAREEDALLAEKTTEDYLDAIPPAVLSQMIEASSSHLRAPSSNRRDHSYETQTGGWNDKLAVYEAKWKEGGGLLPILESQLQKRKERGWKLWDKPLMESEVGQEGFLYDRKDCGG